MIFNTGHRNSKLFPVFLGPQWCPDEQSWPFQTSDAYAAGQSHHLAVGEWRDLDFFCAGPADWVASPLDPRLFQSTAFPELVWNGLLSD